MVVPFTFQQLHLKRISFLLLFILVPNYLVMRAGIAGPIDDRIGVATALDLCLILPLLLYFFGFRQRVSWVYLITFIFLGAVMANLMIPNHADGYLSYFNHSVIVLEAAVIFVEILVLMMIVKRFPTLVRNYKESRRHHYHFLSSLSAAVQDTFTIKRFNKVKIGLRILATDMAAIYYSLFSWRKKPAQGFTFHKDGGYLGVFFMLVHAMVIEIIAVHMMVAQYSHTAAWIVTALDFYALLFIISDYQAIRLCPLVVDEKGLHYQKGIREYGSVPWDNIEGLYKNNELAGKESVELAFHGLEKEPSPYVIKLNRPVETRKIFGLKKTVEAVFLKLDDPEAFRKEFDRYVKMAE
ncbi:hypothetical protein LCM20_13455 [Halobacillus litoralis]|uniref:hypothetical protein n=1 Tax=Halobacillus litoralis TaxID=45668 RepID=UPI001CD593BD|nr:hypothetical protein [Halobacillus litoralis]MCA0971608.1 hypothetical protein [Halobacillus litoralis]